MTPWSEWAFQSEHFDNPIVGNFPAKVVGLHRETFSAAAHILSILWIIEGHLSPGLSTWELLAIH